MNQHRISAARLGFRVSYMGVRHWDLLGKRTFPRHEIDTWWWLVKTEGSMA